MIRGVIPDTVVTSRILTPLPPRLQSFRNVGLVLVAVVGAPLVAAAIDLLRDMLGAGVS
jgi:hypothetical protein